MGSSRQALVLRCAVSAVFLAVALWGVGVSAVLDGLLEAEPGWFALAGLILVGSYLVGVVRWLVLLRAAGLPVAGREAARLTWIGLFFANVLPTGFGGDAVRGWMAGRSTGRMGAAASTVLVDKLAATWALATLGTLALLAEGDELPGEVLAATGAAVAAIAGVSTVVLVNRVPPLARRSPRIAAALGSMQAAVAQLRAGRVLAAAFGLSLLAQGLAILASLAVARSLQLDLSLALVAATVPVALLAGVVPISVNGIGVREAVFRALLVPAGIAAADAVAFSVAMTLLGAVVSLPGIVLWVVGRRGAPAGRSARADPRDPARPESLAG